MKVIIIGAGGHAKVIADALLSRVRFGETNEIVGYLDDDESLFNKEQVGARVIGKISELPNFSHDAIVIGIGNNDVRKKLFVHFKEAGENIITVIHPQTTIGADVVIAEGSVIFAGVVINTGASIGPNVILNTACTVGHDVVINSHAQIGPGVNLGGGVEVGEGAFIGIGSAVIQKKKIGDWTVIGAGAAVIRNISSNKIVVGVPAEPIKGSFRGEKKSVEQTDESGLKGSGRILQSNDADEWNKIVSTSYQYDFYHTLDYHLACEENGEGKPRLFVYEEGARRIALPFLLRQIYTEPWFPNNYHELFDATSVYGYSGPILSEENIPPECIKNFSDSLTSELRKLNVVSLFSRLHPLLDIGLSFDDEFNKRVIGKTVSIDLTISSDMQAAQFCNNHKRDIKKLGNAGFICSEDTNKSYLDDFINIYMETMDRVSADTLYYFPREYFYSLCNRLQDMMHLFICLKDDVVVCAGLFSLCGTIIQYHLGGTKNYYLKYSPMKLLFDYVRKWGIKNHASSFHLGGGIGSSHDSLFHFKAGFSNRLHDFSIWQKIILPDEYKLLCEAKQDYNKKNNLQNINESFFPLYRSKTREINQISGITS